MIIDLKVDTLQDFFFTGTDLEGEPEEIQGKSTTKVNNDHLTEKAKTSKLFVSFKTTLSFGCAQTLMVQRCKAVMLKCFYLVISLYASY